MNVLEKIKKVFAHGLGQQKKLAIFIIENYKQASFMTSTQLAMASHVSSATINRFCQQLGYKGYSDFQSDLQALLQNELTALDRVETRTDQKFALEKVWTTEINALHQALKRISLDSYAEALNLLAQARNVYVVGHQACEPVAVYSAYCLSKIKSHVERFDLGALDCLGTVSRLGPDDVALVFHMPRYPIKTFQSLQILKAAGVKIVMVTHSELCENAQFSDVLLVTPVCYHQFADGLSPLISLVNALALDLYKHNKQEGTRCLQNFENASSYFFIQAQK